MDKGMLSRYKPNVKELDLIADHIDLLSGKLDAAFFVRLKQALQST